MTIKLPTAVDNIIKILNEAGYEAYAVGGCVRDSIIGKQPNDWDITTSALPEQVKKLFKRTVDTGIKHGTVTILDKNDQFEVTTYRIDGDYQDGRHPDSVEFTRELSEDLKRRDFTINAMAYHPKEGLIDLFDGCKDLDNKLLRCVGNPEERFNEDALRMMRAIRFAAQFGFDIEDKTFCAIKKMSANLSKISAERIQVEMVKLITSDNPDFFRLFYESGLTSVFMPEFDRAMLTKQNHPHHMYDVGEHILVALSNIENDKCLRLAMLFHDMAKPDALTIDEEGITHFRGHNKLGEEMSKNIMHRLKFDNATIDIVTKLVLNHDRNIETDKKSVRRCLNSIGKELFIPLMKVKKADTLAQSMYLREEKLENIHRLTETFNELNNDDLCVKISDLKVSGKDLISMGVEPGPYIGKLLDDMLDDVLDNPEHNNRDFLLEKYVKKNI